ncbi:hypothetical protein QUC32_21960 [Novosphingobium resinovorum]|jgi:hypothetical protein|uniref:PRC-barrel protein n=1 Tax=Novosphingobium resinovorum TaxID=158500 RepID=A0A031JU96_9SPHN|nr:MULTISPECIES: hypothetical protein [Sphingomonadaceae]EJU09629.1 hypothetical protein LH128_28023 [Sphingomonas sp. LH128]EZP80358.1 hypothetical protein BV97_03445 [Novosphingobium resinovorum]MBF7012317.1 hypothetical protein [Novosphingobium sp. HR1a]WJM27059.1 hypothetical protein QUC32_21960 [Novosphingobium resinovorum]
MSQVVLQCLQYYGAAAGTVAALIVSLDLGRKWTGWGFVIFVTSSIALVAWGFLDDKAEGIGLQNVALFAINCVGVWRYLLRRKRPG